MSSIIKNQIIKHLSKFTKNLSADKIQISTLKGEGELSNLELNEDVLMELLDLPTWLTLRKAVCNKVFLKIQWSKLKSQPIQVFLDEVRVEMEMTEKLRVPPNTSGLPSYSSGGRYGFGDRIVDGMSLQINAVIVDFNSTAFHAHVNLSRIVIESKTPTWRKTNDLAHTRISEKHRDLLLTFKEIEWQTLRIEADCMAQHQGPATTTPLRLITNQCKLRICVKKRYSDCSIVATKLQFIMDDLLWIITDSQMKAAVIFAKHLEQNIDKSMEQNKVLAANAIQKQKQASHHNSSTGTNHANTSPATAIFNKFDITESSYHIQSGRIDLQFCDDVNVVNAQRGVEGGAVGVAIMKLMISHYPARPIGESRRSWPGYNDLMEGKDRWTADILKTYVEQLRLDIKTGVIILKGEVTPEQIKNDLIERLTMIQVEDFFVTTVSSEHDRGPHPPKLIMSDKKALFLPRDIPAVHVEFTEYFFPHKTDVSRKPKYRTPCPNIYIRVNPIKLCVDTYTITWFNSFALSLSKDVEELIKSLPIDTERKSERVEIRAELLMPKIILSSTEVLPPFQHDRPQSLEIIISKLSVTNKHNIESSFPTRYDEHAALLSRYARLDIAQPPTDELEFPHIYGDAPLISPGHTTYSEDTVTCYTAHDSSSTTAHQPLVEVYSVHLEQFWMEFAGVKNSANRPVSFVESFPVTIWACLPSPTQAEILEDQIKPEKIDLAESRPCDSISILVNIGAKICAQLNHYQLCFLTKLMESFTDMADVIEAEEKRYVKVILPSGDKPTEPEKESFNLTAVVHIKEVQFAMLAPPAACNTVVSTSSTSDELLVERPEEQADTIRRKLDINSLDSLVEVLPSQSADTLQIIVTQASEELTERHTNGNASGSATNLHRPLASTDLSPPDHLDPVTPDSQTDLPNDSDSGVTMQSDSGSDFVYVRERDAVDVHLERSSFYHNPSPPGGGADQKRESRSRFYDSQAPPTEGLPPPQESNRTSNKLSAAFSKVTNKIKSARISKVEDDWDNISLASGLSDENDMILVIGSEEEEIAFSSNHIRALNDDDDSESNRSYLMSTVHRPKQMVSVAMFKVYQIEVGVQLSDKDLTAKILVGGLDNEERGNMYYDTFQERQLAAVKDLNPNMPTDRPIRVRFSKGPASASLANGAEELGFAQVHISDYSLNFLSSTINKLGPLFKDEVASQPLPVLIQISNFDLKLMSSPLIPTYLVYTEDDVPSPYNTDCPNPPLPIHINQLSVIRGSDGVITIQGETMPEMSEALQKPMQAVDKTTDTSGLHDIAEQPKQQLIADPAPVKVKLETNSSSQQLIEEMKHMQAENNALKEQILRLNTKLIEKDQDEFHRFEAINPPSNQGLAAVEVKQLRATVAKKEQEIQELHSEVSRLQDDVEALNSSKECLTQTIEVLRSDLVTAPTHSG